MSNANNTNRPALNVEACKTVTDSKEACRLILEHYGPCHRSVLIERVRQHCPHFKTSSENGIVHRAWSDAKRQKEGHVATFYFAGERIYALVSDKKLATDKRGEFVAQRISKKR